VPRAASRRRPRAWALALALILVARPGPAEPPPARSAGEHDAVDGSLLELGERIYHEGLTTPATPVTASVLGDVPVEGGQAACVNCHRRSGLGISEGETGALPTTGRLLFQARKSGHRPRPAYTEETLARAIRTGIDSADRPLEAPMPAYRFSDREMAGLSAYLETLSATVSPGVTDTSIHFATVLTEEVDADRRQAMLDVLETFFNEKNAQSRAEGRRAQRGPFYRDFSNKSFREWRLHRWLLSGAPETWPQQLDDHYRRRPVFALVSGISTRQWQPVHAFCESRGVPCILPNTDLPVTGSEDFYTTYFSEGLTLEAKSIAEHVWRRGGDQQILQVFRPQTAGSVAARALRSALVERGRRAPVDWSISADHEITTSELVERRGSAGANVIVAWLGPADLARLEHLPRGDNPVALYLSSTLLDGEIAEVPAAIQPIGMVAHPYTLPEHLENRFGRVDAWLKSRKIEPRHPRIQAQTFFACMVTGRSLMHIRTFFYRDYFMDSIDHAEGLARISAFYPRPSFGPGQRYLAKGSYLVESRGAGQSALVSKASWVVP